MILLIFIFLLETLGSYAFMLFLISILSNILCYLLFSDLSLQAVLQKEKWFSGNITEIWAEKSNHGIIQA
jgi:uncharacterized protein (DUF58 family)